METTAEQVTELQLEFEALAHADRTSIRWERAHFSAVEFVRVEHHGGDEQVEQLVEVDRDVWAQFLDLVLNEVLPERQATAAVPADTQPEMKTPDMLPDLGQHLPDTPTSPNRATAETFLRCSISLVLPNGRRTSVTDGPAVMNLYARVYGFAQESGLELPG